jgi:methionine synthase II (cobalamin-independent)
MNQLGAEHSVIHCCAADPPLAIMAEAGAVSIDGTLPYDADVLGDLLEGGTGLLFGAIPTSGPLPTVAQVLETVARLRDRCGAEDVALTPACGLAGATASHARAVMTRLVEAAKEVGG